MPHHESQTKMLERFMAQAPEEDGTFFADAYCPSSAIRMLRIQKMITQFDKAHVDNNEPPCTPCLFSFAGCPYTCSEKLSWAHHVRHCHLQMCSYTRTQCSRTKSRAQSPTTRSFADEDHSCPILRKCLVSGCSRQFSGENVLEKWLAHLYTHMEQDRSQTFKALEGNSKLIEWSSKPDTGIIQKVAGKWTLRKCLCRTLEDYKMLLPSPSTESRPSSMSMDSSDYAYSRFSQAWDEVSSRKSSPTAETVPGQAPSNHESSRRSLDGEHVSPSDLLDEFRHFTISWFSAWLATQPGSTELNPGNQSTQEYRGRVQGQPSQQQKRKARGQNDKNRGERKARRRDWSDEGDPDDNDNGGPSAAQSAPPDLEDEKFLACPFNKQNPSYFRHGRFSLCESGGWKSYHRVRSA